MFVPTLLTNWFERFVTDVSLILHFRCAQLSSLRVKEKNCTWLDYFVKKKNENMGLFAFVFPNQ